MTSAELEPDTPQQGCHRGVGAHRSAFCEADKESQSICSTQHNTSAPDKGGSQICW